ncbi:hypothetical protein [Thiohalocapsa marina]|uniref:hypothetical protein n=1 Tax=Thiohalocapsa marina TaxID=424902 RepID=UPI0036DD5F71
MTGTKVPVSERALIARINRRLPGDVRLKKLKGDRWLSTMGRFYTLDERLNAVIDKFVDPEALAREIGALADYEMLAVESDERQDAA